MRTTILMAVGLLALAACAEPPPPAPPAPPPRPAPAPAPYQPRPSADQCGAVEAQRFVGRSRSDIPVPVQPALQRVACTTCPVTMDFNPRRLNFFYDAATGVVKEVRCG
ncbi:peptidase inhibitor I78 [Phenylobacterium sp.]|uniref:peptidase inhibitor I78 n=1 Tax=Phenylobacterium sp. TaxID=1871053 RepID=UPI0027352666|nr:peptidase inhibitor I78 [Phenylobacterium sp.]MDP3853217.1 peptidase inhibitor I78 [Phenylobacterium sp.]